MNTTIFKPLLAGIIICLFCSVVQAQSKSAPVVKTPQDLAINRAKIDSLDDQLMKILGERERIVQAIGVYKAKNHIPPLQEARFRQVVEKSIEAGKKEGLSAEFITELMNAIHKESLRIENDSAVKQ